MKDPAAPDASEKDPVLPAPRKLGAVPWTGPGAPQHGRTRLATAVLVAAIVAVALNQRPAVVAVAPVLGELRADTGLSSALAGLLTTLPVLCFGAFAPLAPRLARRIGLETAVGLSLGLLALAALALWLPVAGTGHDRRTNAPLPEGQGSWSLLRQPLAVQVTAYIGLQSVQFYSVAAWLPTLLADADVPASEGGLLLGLANLVGAAGALLAPAQAGRMRTQRPLVLAVALAYAVGLDVVSPPETGAESPGGARTPAASAGPAGPAGR